MTTLAPYLCKLQVGDRVLPNSPDIHMDAVGTVTESWYVPSGCPERLGHWRIKVQSFSGGKLHTWEASDRFFRPAVVFDGGMFDFEHLQFDDHNPHLIPDNHIWVEWAFYAAQRKQGYEPWHGKKFYLGNVQILSLSLDSDGVFHLNFPEGIMRVFTDQLLIRVE